MNRITIILVSLLFTITSHASLEWSQLPLDAVLQKSQQENKPVLAYIYADWCIYCKKLKKETFAISYVQEKMNQYVLLKVNGDDDGLGREFVDKYGGGSFPTTIFLNSQGVEYNRAVGYFKPDPFVKVLEENLSQENVYERLGKELEVASETGKGFSKALMAYLEKNMDATRFDKVQDYLEKYLPDPRLKDHLFTLRLMRGTIAYRQKDYKRSQTLLKVALDSAESEEEFMNAVRWLGRAAMKLKQPKKRLEYYQLAIDKFGSYKAYNGYAWYAYKSKINLDLALDYAKTAVELSGEDAGVMDTLAHVHYARKEFSMALDISRKILLKDNSKSYQKAHKKYLKARKKQILAEI